MWIKNASLVLTADPAREGLGLIRRGAVAVQGGKSSGAVRSTRVEEDDEDDEDDDE